MTAWFNVIAFTGVIAESVVTTKSLPDALRAFDVLTRLVSTDIELWIASYDEAGYYLGVSRVLHASAGVWSVGLSSVARQSEAA